MRQLEQANKQSLLTSRGHITVYLLRLRLFIAPANIKSSHSSDLLSLLPNIAHACFPSEARGSQSKGFEMTGIPRQGGECDACRHNS